MEQYDQIWSDSDRFWAGRYRNFTRSTFHSTQATRPPAGLSVSPANTTDVSDTPLSVRILGNPVHGSTITVEVRGAEDQSLHFQLMDVRGRLVSEQQLETAGTVEQQTLDVGNQPTGLFVLRVSTPTQSRTLKVLKAE